MKFSYNWLKELVRFKESPEKLAEVLTLHAFEYETIEKVGSDWAIDIKIPANRMSDAAGHIGLAGEIAVILGKHKTQIPNHKQNTRPTSPASELAGGRAKYKTQSTKTTSPIQIKISNLEICPRYTAQELTLKTIGPSPKWMREKLITCGFRPIDAVVDVTNYVMLEMGQPLHAFDAEKIKGRNMTVREAKKGEELTTLDGVKHKLPEGAIIIEDENRIIDLAGIMGGANSAVGPRSRRVLLQAAVFDPVRIYKTTRDLKFISAASKIYASGVDLNGTRAALERAIGLLQEIAGAEEDAPLIDIYPKKIAFRKIKFRPNYVDGLIGQPLGENFYKKTFTEFGFKVAKKGKDLWVEIPTRRRDIELEEDLIEEAVRIFGYEKIKPKMPEIALAPPVRNDELWWEERVRDYLAGAGFTEHLPYEFIGDQELALFQLDPSEAIEVANPISSETKYLCPRILIKYVTSAAENARSFDTVKVSGIAKSFKKKDDGAEEHKDLVVVLSRKGASGEPRAGTPRQNKFGTGQASSVRGEDEFYELKGILDQLFENLGISDYWYDDEIELGIRNKELGIFHPYRVAQINVGDERIGNVGEIHPVVSENIKSRARIVAAELDFEKLWKLARAEQEFLPIGKYPAIIRDIAVVVPANTKADDVQEIIENIGGKLLVDSDLFDYFQDEQMREAEGKSLAFHLIFQSPERTLKDEEVNVIVGKIIKALEEKEWKVRK